MEEDEAGETNHLRWIPSAVAAGGIALTLLYKSYVKYAPESKKRAWTNDIVQKIQQSLPAVSASATSTTSLPTGKLQQRITLCANACQQLLNEVNSPSYATQAGVLQVLVDSNCLDQLVQESSHCIQLIRSDVAVPQQFTFKPVPVCDSLTGEVAALGRLLCAVFDIDANQPTSSASLLPTALVQQVSTFCLDVLRDRVHIRTDAALLPVLRSLLYCCQHAAVTPSEPVPFLCSLLTHPNTNLIIYSCLCLRHLLIDRPACTLFERLGGSERILHLITRDRALRNAAIIALSGVTASPTVNKLLHQRGIIPYICIVLTEPNLNEDVYAGAMRILHSVVLSTVHDIHVIPSLLSQPLLPALFHFLQPSHLQLCRLSLDLLIELVDQSPIALQEMVRLDLAEAIISLLNLPHFLNCIDQVATLCYNIAARVEDAALLSAKLVPNGLQSVQQLLVQQLSGRPVRLQPDVLVTCGSILSLICRSDAGVSEVCDSNLPHLLMSNYSQVSDSKFVECLSMILCNCAVDSPEMVSTLPNIVRSMIQWINYDESHSIIRYYGVSTLRNLGIIRAIAESPPVLQQLSSLVQMSVDKHVSDQLRLVAIICVGNCSLTSSLVRTVLYEAKVVPQYMNLMMEGGNLSLTAAAALMNLTSDPSIATGVVKVGAVPVLLHWLKSKQHSWRHISHACGILANCCTHDPTVLKTFRDMNGLELLAHIMVAKELDERARQSASVLCVRLATDPENSKLIDALFNQYNESSSSSGSGGGL